MNNEIERNADLIWSSLNSIKNHNKSKKDQLEIIESILHLFYEDSKNLGRLQILNKLTSEINLLKDN